MYVRPAPAVSGVPPTLLRPPLCVPRLSFCCARRRLGKPDPRSPGTYWCRPASTRISPASPPDSTALPISGTNFNISNVTTSGTGPFTVTVTTGTSKNGYVPGQTVVISGVGGATGVNGTQVIDSIPSTTSFTISLAAAPGTYTSGGTVVGNIAIAGNQYPEVFNNDLVDSNFGITEPIFLDQIPATTSLVTSPISTIEVPNSDTNPSGDQLVTSFSSKSELALNQSTDGQYVSFVGYHAPTAAIDVSNANTPNEQDPTNTDTANGGAGYYRDAAVMDDNGNFQFTETGAYGGNNGRSAILDPANNTLFLAGNAGNGSTPSYQGVVIGSGSQIMTEGPPLRPLRTPLWPPRRLTGTSTSPSWATPLTSPPRTTTSGA